jgi:hypothetical protein
MPVCVCDRPDAQADTPDATDVIDAPPIACDVGVYCMQSGGCVNTSVNILHCGRCGNRCAAGLVCEDGACISADASVRDIYRDMGVDTRAFIDLDVYESCRTNIDCNNNLDDGCESNPMTDPNHCGGCDGPRCGGNAARYVLPACRNGMCAGRCVAGRYNCDGDAVNGCESAGKGVGIGDFLNYYEHQRRSDRDHNEACAETEKLLKDIAARKRSGSGI